MDYKLKAIELNSVQAAAKIFKDKHHDMPREHAEVSGEFYLTKEIFIGYSYEIYFSEPLEIIEPAHDEPSCFREVIQNVDFDKFDIEGWYEEESEEIEITNAKEIMEELKKNF